MIIYSHVYDYCISNPGQPKTTSISNTKGGLNRGNAQDGANIVGGELYNKLKNYLKTYLDDICQVNNRKKKSSRKKKQNILVFRVELIYKMKMFFVFIQIVGKNINFPVK